MNDSGPEGFPPPESFSRCERSVERSVPVPEPNLKSMASLRASSMMSSMLSCTLWMKHAEACGILVGVLRLDRLAGRRVPVPVAHRPLDAVLVVQAHVEPDRRIERRRTGAGRASTARGRNARRRPGWRNSRRRCPSRRSCGRRGGSTGGRPFRARPCPPRRRNTCWPRRSWPIGSRRRGSRNRAARTAPRPLRP